MTLRAVLAREYGISREEADAFALRSHQRAMEAWEAGRFDAEVVPVEVPQPKGDSILFARDEGIRSSGTPEKMAKLRPIMGEGYQVTAGNASQQNDAAAAGCDPRIMGIGPVPSTKRLFDRFGLSLSDMDVIELNEAFAAQALSVLRA